MILRASYTPVFLCIVVSALASSILPACGEDGFTPDCSELPLYESSRDPNTGAAYRHKPGDPSTRLTASEESQLTEAINAGCITGPGNARSIDAEDL